MYILYNKDKLSQINDKFHIVKILVGELWKKANKQGTALLKP